VVTGTFSRVAETESDRSVTVIETNEQGLLYGMSRTSNCPMLVISMSLLSREVLVT
jgi:hypothetical protein